jgi:hypothetical protein
MTFSTRIRLVAALLALVLVPGVAYGQATQVGQLGGEVKDATGGVLPGATVTLTSVERGFTRSAVTDSLGRFLFTAVPIGRYTVSVGLQSFQTVTLTDNLVEAERTTNVPVSLKVAGVEVATTVTGSTPIVDAKNQTLETRVRAEEFSRMAVGRNYQSLIGAAPGVVGTGNVNSHGALTNSNIFMFDGVNTTDPTTGTIGTNLNFESIQEVVIRTSAVGVEYGRGTGAIVDVITKSGTNKFEGFFKYIATNDNWNEQNTTRNQITNASLARTKFDKVNPVYSVGGGGPIVQNRAWFYATYENSKNTTPQRQTNADTARGFANENFQQTTESPFWTARVNAQLRPNHNVWVKYSTSPTDGFINDYWGNSAELNALTSQNQGGTTLAAQYNGVLGTKWTASLMASRSTEFIDVVPYRTTGAIENGAPFWDTIDDRFYNGATFDGTVDRPRKQASGSMEYFTSWMGNSHAVKFGVDWQDLTSTNFFRYPQNRLFYVENFNPVTKTYTPLYYEEYEDAPSSSKGKQTAFYARDKFQVGPRVSLEAGIRFEKQTGTSDVGAGTVDTTVISPRVSGSYSVTSDNKTIIVGSFGRFHDNILQTFSDAFGAVPQQTNFKSFKWNGSAYVLDFEFKAGASTFKPNLDITPRHLDEWTVGMERQLSNVLGVGVRYIWREWGNFIDDVFTFANDGVTVNRTVTNIDSAFRTYKGIEFTVDKRLSHNWAAGGSYTYSETRGNHFDTGDNFTALGNYENENCRQTADPSLGDANGVFPCSQVIAKLSGRPTFDRPHLIKFGGSYRRPLGPIDLTAGLSGSAVSKTTFSKTRTVSVLRPGTTSAQTTLTYNYEGLGSDRVEGLAFTSDLAIEATYRAARRSDVGVKFEAFNLFNNEEQISVNNTSWCNSSATATCSTARTNYGTATARASFLAPRTYRLTFLVRF